jgi:hypothetical protein
MKKLFLFVLGILFLSPKMTAREQIPFTISGDIIKVYDNICIFH